ncbi:metal-dependent hydrolase [Halostella sp. JP-L12]|uniref:metal-dependent hydrolase n=1 Tax=Halostella TaxID=1843185 RepID=UPI000EF760C2|nr:MULTISPECIES: metal-dependent hydrolase [Halostella]NHN49360.1 metal-dependent hydrolase [Halostella sp. JP-L12]
MSEELTIEYEGLSAFSIESSNTSLIVDPWLEPAWIDATVDDFEHVDYVFVTHGAHDHLGSTYEIADRSGATVITEPAVADHLTSLGLSDDQVQSMVWGNRLELSELGVRALETSHISYFESQGEHVTGTALGFLFEFESRTIYYLGDTALFSDLEMFGERYDPDVALLPVGAAPGALAPLPPDEAATAADWLDITTAIPVHYVPDDGTPEVFEAELGDLDSDVNSFILEPGESLTLS